jgi:beta-galactosidase
MKRRAFLESMTAAGAAAVVGMPAVSGGWSGSSGRRVERLDDGWKFVREDPAGAEQPDLDDATWAAVSLPHAARIEDLVPTPQWQGVCWYRRRIRVEPDVAAADVLLRFEGAMNVADVWLDGQRVGGHLGGYLPFVLDLGGRLRPGRDHLLAVRLDNRDNPITGPKPLAQLDFNLYHGLYRPVYLTRKDRLAVTDPLLADRPGGGGILVTYPVVSRERATVRVQAHVRNRHGEPRDVRLRLTLRSADGRVAATATTPPVAIAAGEDRHLTHDLEVRSPRLWSPGSPSLYRMDCEVLAGERVTDSERLRIGIRRIAIGERASRSTVSGCSSAARTGTRSTRTSATRCRTPRSTATPAGSRRPVSTTCGSRTTRRRPPSWTRATSSAWW